MFQFGIGQDSAGVICGLTDDPIGNSYNTINYGIYAEHGLCRVMESGAIQTAHSAYTTDTVFTIARTGEVVTFWSDYTLLYTSLQKTSNDLYADCALYAGGDRIL